MERVPDPRSDHAAIFGAAARPPEILMTTQRMARFHTLEVEEVHQETPDCIVVGLKVPAAEQADFLFVHGQYLTLKLTVNGEELRRSYSICSSPLDVGHLRIAVKKVEKGRASTQLVDKLKAGMRIEVMTPMGSFTTALDATKERHFVAFAAGSGITPILSILKTVLRTEPKSRFTLFYGNTDQDRIIFRQRLEELKQQHGERLFVHHILSKGMDEDKLFNGRISTEKSVELLKRFVNDPMDKEFFICGPEQMMVNVSEALEKQGVDKKHIHIELFNTPVSTEVKKEKDHAHGSGGDFTGTADVKVILDGRETELKIPAKGDPVLDVALDAGLDVPFACKGAVCCTCKARVLEGQVEMEMNYALTDEEVADGYVLTCQTHPRSQRVVIDYDQH
ncbi:MAG: phenylacetate-CoA oxygenase/reductase subunit PaaK [Flavobacteriales bacterium]|nr:phenylacetate-CoA oxygenase/reductase subunit PaaK [Flavobacteriales bacterium]MCC6938497.1 phenylacetate-CoA oxygenase/reductase subunit PaaK [Flavobacteriales bacterium]